MTSLISNFNLVKSFILLLIKKSPSNLLSSTISFTKQYPTPFVQLSRICMKTNKTNSIKIINSNLTTTREMFVIKKTITENYFKLTERTKVFRPLNIIGEAGKHVDAIYWTEEGKTKGDVTDQKLTGQGDIS